MNLGLEGVETRNFDIVAVCNKVEDLDIVAILILYKEHKVEEGLESSGP